MKALFLLAFFSGLLMINTLPIPNGSYRIKSAKYGTYWDLCGSDTSCSNPFNIFLNHFLGDIFQTFVVSAAPNGYYTITAFYNGKVVTVADSKNPADTIFLADAKSEDYNQQFVFVARGDNAYIIKPRTLLKEAIQPPAKESDEIFLDNKDCKTSQQHFVLEPLPDWLTFGNR